LNQKGEGGGIKLRRSLNILKKLHEKAMKITSVADPDPGSGAFLTPGSGIRDGEKVRIRIRDEQPGSYFQELRNHFLG
jgi:hypothetical protein